MAQIHPNRTTLRISPIPFKSSLLAIPPSPFSPRTPLTPVACDQKLATFSSSLQNCSTSPPSGSITYATTPPPQPLNWQWKCHQCAQSYSLSATRRCLDDGHHFCSGTTTVKAWRDSKGKRRPKKHRACTSEFDYSGWKTWSRWRHGTLEHVAVQKKGTDKGLKLKDCWNQCSYPSECRWGKEYGVHTPVTTSFSNVKKLNVLSNEVLSLAVDNSIPTPIQSMEGGVQSVEDNNNSSNRISMEGSMAGKDESFWTALVAKVEQRKRGSAHLASPLSVVVEEGSQPPSPTNASLIDPPSNSKSRIDQDGDTIMSPIDPQSLTSSAKSCIAPSSPEQKPRSSATALRNLWTREKTTSKSPLRFRRRNSNSPPSSKASFGGLDGRTHSSVGRSAATMDLHAQDQGTYLLEEFGVPIKRTVSRDSGYGSCV